MLLGACREVGRGQSRAPQHPPAHECLSNGLITPMRNPAQVSSLMAGGTSIPAKIPHYPRGEEGQNGECFPGKIPRACPGARKSALSPQPGAQDEASDPTERQGRQSSLPQGDMAAQRAVLTVEAAVHSPPGPEPTRLMGTGSSQCYPGATPSLTSAPRLQDVARWHICSSTGSTWP